MKSNPGLYTYLMRMAVQIKRLLNGTLAQSKFTRYLESIQYLPPEELTRLQNIELSKILTHAVNNIPYYKSLQGHFELSEKSASDDIKHFPIITKEILSTQKEHFLDPEIPVVKSMYSGGTTMTRVSVNTGKYFENHKANEYFNRIIGIYPGMGRFILTRHESTYNEGGPLYNEIQFSANKFSRTYQVSPDDFNTEKLRAAYKILMKEKPRIFKGNSTMLFEFARSIEKNGWEAPCVPIAYCGESNMQPEYIETLERVFGSKVYDGYGATESGAVGVQCEKQDGLHYIPVLHYLETLVDGNQVEPDEIGRLTITSLAHYAMPIIRYQIGDFATLTEKQCSCGRTFPMLNSINGRISEYINSPVGTMASVYEIKKFLAEITEIIDYQAVQVSPDSIELRLKCTTEGLAVEHISAVKNEINRILEFEMNIKVKYVDEIAHLPSGKILRIISLERYKRAVAAGEMAGSI